jgi:hypothetical protein
LCLGLFPSTFALETVGFNLWMASVGPCPLLERLESGLRARGACLRYLDLHDRATFTTLARQTAEHALIELGHLPALTRITRGFIAAHESYLRWQRSVLGDAVPLLATYTPPRDPRHVEAFAFERYGKLSNADLFHCFANSDCHPAIGAFGHFFVAQVLAKLSHALDTDERLNSTHPPHYSERLVAELVAEQHMKNVRSRGAASPTPVGAPAAPQHIGPIFDGCWLQGFADVLRADFEEYGWLFRIYASEHGDGEMAYNHCRIFRFAFSDLGADVMLPKSDPRLYRLFDVGLGSIATLAASLNTRRFMPELLGMNLAIEATGVGGAYLESWKSASGQYAQWKALAARLHNSIDNYADGHTKWSLNAVQAFMRRVRDGSPSEVQAQWHRIWRLWRCQDILTHGTPSERAALAEYFDVTTLAPF